MAKTKKRSSFLDSALEVQQGTSASVDSAIIVGEGDQSDRSAVDQRLAATAEAEKIVHRKQMAVDPSDCSVWQANPRNQERLDYETCRELIENLITIGRQEVPAIARRAKSGPKSYEVLVGSKRRWSIDWLRKNGHPDFKFVIELRDYNDHEAFLLCDTENREREDVSDYERSISYKQSLGDLFGGKQTAMAEALGKTDAWLSRYLQMSELPVEIPNAYGTWKDFKKNHAPTLLKIFKIKTDRPLLLQKAADLEKMQSERSHAGDNPVSGAEVFKLLSTIKPKPKAKKKAPSFVKSYGPTGKPHLVVERQNQHAMKLSVSLVSGATKDQLMEHFKECLEGHFD